MIGEAIEYKLVKTTKDRKSIHLTELGTEILLQYEERGSASFNEELFKFMERKYGAFRYVISKLYAANRSSPGLLFLPSYSPRQLGFDRESMKTTNDFIEYSTALVERLENDMDEYIGERKDLRSEHQKLVRRLIKTGLLHADNNKRFDPTKYNVITKRFRDFWMSFFLQKVYHYDYSMHSFDIWIYRGKQIGVIHATEFHPYFNGKIVYPLSVILKSVESRDFNELYRYPDGYGFFMHKPKWDKNQERFVDAIWKAYVDLRRIHRSYFVNLMALREIVCLNAKISEKTFEDFMNRTYRLNLMGSLQIRISLEVDKLPEETGAMYLKREPVMIDNKYRNIIAIDATKGGRAEK